MEVADYRRHAERRGVLEMSEGFDWQRQLLINTAIHMLVANAGVLVLGFGFLLLVAVLLVMRRRRAA